ncbi:hypothetical protein [Cohnella zeiphila]|uniref:Uncharacterized protein n=1 Tax=Cohnella zeiphila TaxID=2761120 RepID=A0A7X0SN33_9BACL|nr:hypothetical protein [Cohnella zeiphila]MBB6731924.1 hypothetical protein [Cohnella zeiphila]
MKEREFSYQEGITEGRLIENGFFAIGKSMFVCRTNSILYIVTNPQEGDSRFELIELNSEQPEKEMEYTAFIEWARNDDFNYPRIDVKGSIHDIIEIAKIAKANFK